MTQIPQLTERVLLRAFAEVPREVTTIYDWHSPEGQRFIDSVESALEEGVDINRIGQALGISNFATRYRIIRSSR